MSAQIHPQPTREAHIMTTFTPGDIVSVRSASNVVDSFGRRFRHLAVVTSGPFALNYDAGAGYTTLGPGEPAYPFDQTHHRAADLLPLGEDDGLTVYGDADALPARYAAFRAWAYPVAAR